MQTLIAEYVVRRNIKFPLSQRDKLDIITHMIIDDRVVMDRPRNYISLCRKVLKNGKNIKLLQVVKLALQKLGIIKN